MGGRLQRAAAQHPGRALGLLAAVAVLGTALAAGGTERLALSSHEGRGPGLEIRVAGRIPAGSPAFRVVVRTMRTRLLSDPAVGTVRERRPRGNAFATTLLVRFRVAGERRDAAIARLQRDLDPGPLRVSFRGPTSVVEAARDKALDALVPLLVCLPLIGLVAVATLGIRPGGAALLAAGAASAVAVLACELAGGAFDVFWLALVGAIAGGTLVSLQLCAMAARGMGADAIGASGLAAAAAFGAAALLGVDYLASLGLGGAAGSLLAVPASLTAMGATGHRAGTKWPNLAGAPWRGLAGLLAYSPLLGAAIALLGVVLLLILAAPAERLATAAIGAPEAPAIEAARLAAAIGVAGLATLAIAWVAGRRAWLALSGTVAWGLPALATVGLLANVFGEGRLAGLLDYSPSGAVQLGSLAAAASVVAALGAAQAVALAAAARQAEAGTAGALRVVEAIGRCGPAVALSCLAGAGAGVALAFGSPRFVMEFGLATAAGLMLELLVVQALVAPSLLRLARGGAGRRQ